MNQRACETYGAKLFGLVENALQAEEAEELRRHLAYCPACREEYEWLVGAKVDLEALGDSLLVDVPHMNLVPGVLDAVGKLTATPERAPAPRRLWWRPTFTVNWAAAAAGVLVALGIATAWWLLGLNANVPERMAHGPAEGHGLPSQDEAPTPLPGTSQNPELHLAQGTELPVEPTAPPSIIDETAMEATTPPDLAQLTIQDVIAARRDGGADNGPLQRLTQWASLTKEQARAVAERAEASDAAIVGASQALAPEEAELLLLKVVGHSPDDPYLRFALARKTSERTTTATEPVQLASLHDLDPDNALTYYMEARLLLENGNLEKALSMLAQARELDKASAYALQAAAYREQALVESGMDPQAAKLLTALTAGAEERDFLCGLGDTLLEYGKYYEETGDIETAQAIYEAVQELGVQLDEGAQFAQEELAGLDIQRAAIEMLRGLYVYGGIQEDTSELSAETSELVASIESLVDFFHALDNLFQGQVDTQFFVTVAELIMQGGDLGLFDLL